jgi:hypothetical protein
MTSSWPRGRPFHEIRVSGLQYLRANNPDHENPRGGGQEDGVSRCGRLAEEPKPKARNSRNDTTAASADAEAVAPCRPAILGSRKAT